MNRALAAGTLALLAAVAMAPPFVIGYSGAPGTFGTCAGACHGSSGGTIEIVGFPAAYEAGQSYVVSVVHRGGLTINNFNASVRVGSGSTNAGTITAGYQTEIYSAYGETNGVHLSSDNQDSCTFNWQAPDLAVGDVKLYVAGLQGTVDGPNTVVVLTASQMPGVSEETSSPVRLALVVAPTVAGSEVSIRASIPSGMHPSFRVLDCGGRLVARIAVPKSNAPFSWRPLDREGKRLVAGTYLVVLQGNRDRLVRKLVLK